MIKLREATMNDAARLFYWRREPTADVASALPPPESFAAHLRWLDKILHDDTVDLHIAHDIAQGVTVGMVRLDYNADQEAATISIAVDPQRRGHSYAAEMLEAVLATPLVAHAPARRFYAFVKETNYASLRLFWSAGFRGDEAHDGLLRLVKTL